MIPILWSEVGIHRLVATGEIWAAVDAVSGEDANVINPPSWPNRPLRWVPHWIAYSIYPPSFDGYNIFLLGLFFLRGLGVYLLVRELFPSNYFIPLAAAGLFLIYPAGTGWYNFRALTNQSATILGFYAVWLLLVTWRTSNVWLWPFVLFFEVSSLLTYEQYYGVFAVAPILIFWQDGRITQSRRFFRFVIPWYVAWLLSTIRYVWLIRTSQNNSYVQDITGSTGDSNLFQVIYENLWEMYVTHVEAWGNAFEQLNLDSRYVLPALLVAMIFGAAAYIVHRISETNISAKRFGIFIVGALLYMGLSFAHYTLFSDRVGDGIRLYFVTTLFASVIMAATIYYLTKPLHSVIPSLLLAFFMFLGSVDAMLQLRTSGEQSMHIQRLLASVVEVLPENQRDAKIVVLDDAVLYQNDAVFGRTGRLRRALRYLYNRERGYGNVFLCAPRYSSELCEMREDGIHFRNVFNNFETTLQYEDVIILSTTADEKIHILDSLPAEVSGETTRYQPRELLPTEPPPQRVRDFFTCWPLAECDW
jgi:hypothetical protein